MIRHLVLATGLASLLGSPLAAQQRDTARLDSVVVTATRADVALPAASLATTVLTGDALRARGITTLADALRIAPGVAVVRSGSYGAITSLFVRGGESDYVKVLVDGIPLNAAGGGIDLASITVDGAERVEIVRGPASVLYGSDAVTGVVNIITRDGAGAARGSVEARSGSHAWREAAAEVTGGERVRGAASASWRSTDGIHPFNSGHRSSTYDATLRLGGDGGSRGNLRLDARYSDVESHYPTNGQGQLVDSNQVRTEQRRIVGLSAGWLFGARVAGRLELSHGETDAVSDNRPDSEGDSLGFYSRSESDAARQRIDARLELHLHERALVTVGSEWSRQREVAHGSSVSGTTPLPDTRFDASRLNRALYAQLLSGGFRRFSATLGARVDDNERFGTFVTSRAAAAWRANGTTLRVAAGTAFREPAFAEHFTTDFSVGNPALDPERTTSWEAGIAHAVGGAVVSATWFDQRFRDMIQYTFQEEPTAPNYVNLASARASGLEVEARLAPIGALDASASYTLVRTRVLDAGTGDFGAFEEGKPLLRRPRHSASALARWRLGGRGAISAEATWVGRRDDLDFSTFPAVRRELASYALVDLGMELDVLRDESSSALRLTLRVENAFDEKYQPAYGFVPPGRAVFVGARAMLGR